MRVVPLIILILFSLFPFVMLYSWPLSELLNWPPIKCQFNCDIVDEKTPHLAGFG